MVIGRDGKLFDSPRSARGERNDSRSGNFLKSSSVYFGMIIFASISLRLTSDVVHRVAIQFVDGRVH